MVHIEAQKVKVLRANQKNAKKTCPQVRNPSATGTWRIFDCRYGNKGKTETLLLEREWEDAILHRKLSGSLLFWWFLNNNYSILYPQTLF